MSIAKQELKIELKGHVYESISVADFVKIVWDLDGATVDLILSRPWTLRADSLQKYEDVYIDIVTAKPEPMLHQPFREISAALLEEVCAALDLSYADTIKDDFWDGQGSKYIRSRYSYARGRKPDMLRGWTPFTEDILQWGETKSALEFKLTIARRRERRIAKGLSVPTPKTPPRKKTGGKSKKPSGEGFSLALQSIQEDGEDNGPSAVGDAFAVPSRPSNRHSSRNSASNSISSQASRSSARSQSSTQSRSTTQTSSTARSGSSSGTSSTSTKRSFGELDGPSEENASKKAKVEVQPAKTKVTISGDELQLAVYALECLGDSSRHFTTGIFIDGTSTGLWYYDRAAVIQTVPFDFDTEAGARLLAVSLFALSQATLRQVGFDPHVYEFKRPEDGQVVTKANIVALDRPQPESKKPSLCFQLSRKLVTEGGRESFEEIIFVVNKVLYTYRAIVGRGTYVAAGVLAQIGAVLSNVPRVLKLSWQYPFRTHEADILDRARSRLPEYWHKHLPQTYFNAVYTSEKLELPRTKLKDVLKEPNPEKPILDRSLHALVTKLYGRLYEAASVEEFKQIFLDCLECHYHTYKTGRVLHRDISENNLMFERPERQTQNPDESTTPPTPVDSIWGVLNDFDLASEVGEDGKVPASSADHRTGTLPFMAKELAKGRSLSLPSPIHYYRHDLESFFYILVWAAVHYTFKKDRRGKSIRRATPEIMRGWNRNSSAYSEKACFYDQKFSDIGALVQPDFKDLWKKWVVPLWYMFRAALHDVPSEPDHPELKTYDYETCYGRLTFERFMATIKERPRGLHPGQQTLKSDVAPAAA
ncbi:unnamed protein product [Cyclocybe aegerita]|uniref:Protein kinase domain-containing protein n=1 Tax=Cyclocybe aegerita TaxID=1973307 RepID=A0A8S0VXS1_CYCAE|nr:unnamed protein product [Cyclocybe aegerita]